MNKLLSDTRYVLAFAALVIVCATVLVALDKVLWPDAVKVLSGMLGGLVVAWKRGSELSAEEAAAVDAYKKEAKKTSIPPILPLLGICLAFLFLPGASCAGAKPIIRTVNDIAAEWCAAHYSQLNGISVEDAVKTFCTGEEALAPWLRIILAGQKNGVGKSGVGGEPECEVTVTPPPAAVDAGKD